MLFMTAGLNNFIVMSFAMEKASSEHSLQITLFFFCCCIAFAQNDLFAARIAFQASEQD